MCQWKAARNLDRADGVSRPERTHGHAGIAGERAGRNQWDIRSVHRHARTLGVMAQLKAITQKRILEGIRAADHEGDEIIAPEVADIGYLLDKLAVPPVAARFPKSRRSYCSWSRDSFVQCRFVAATAITCCVSSGEWTALSCPSKRSRRRSRPIWKSGCGARPRASTFRSSPRPPRSRASTSRWRLHRLCSRQLMRPKIRSGIFFAVVLAFLLPAVGAVAQQEAPEAPFGDRVSERIPFYHRAAPTIATAGPRRASGVLGMRHHSPIRASVCQTRYRNHAQTGLPADLRRAFDIRCVKLTSGAWRQFCLAKTSLLTSSPCPPLSCHSHCRNSRHRQLDLSHPMVRGRGGQQ